MTKKIETKKAAGQKRGGEKSKQAKEATTDTKPEASAATEPASTQAPQQPDDSGELVVFAFRLTRAERDLIHEAAGSAKASKFVRSVALAAARRDTEALAAAIQATEEIRKG